MIVGVLLAAGAGDRFGGGKLLALLPDGTPVGVRSARVLRASVDRAVAVVRADDVALGVLLAAEGLEVLPFTLASDGMGASLAFGVSASRDADGWIVALADMPFVRQATVEAVRHALLAGAGIAAPALRGVRGHPVGFSAAFGDDLTQLRGDVGARLLLLRHSAQVTLLECDDTGISRDVDHPGDLPDGGQTVDR